LDRGLDQIETGIPRNARIHQLLFNAPARVLIALAHCPFADDLAIGRLFLRAIGETRYSAAPSRADNVDFSHPVSCRRDAAIYVNTLEWTKSRRSWGGDWIGVSRLDLVRGTLDDLCTPANLAIPDGYERGWVTDLISAWDEGVGVTCIAGFERDLGNDCAVVDYSLCDLDLTTCSARVIAPLLSPFV